MPQPVLRQQVSAFARVLELRRGGIEVEAAVARTPMPEGHGEVLQANLCQIVQGIDWQEDWELVDYAELVYNTMRPVQRDLSWVRVTRGGQTGTVHLDEGD